MRDRKKPHRPDRQPEFDCVRLRDENRIAGEEATAADKSLPLSWIAGGILAVTALILGWLLWPGRSFTPVTPAVAPKPKPFVMPDENLAFASYAGSASCKACHPVEHAKWQQSNHGMAERNPRDDLDLPAFEPPRSFTHGSQTTTASRGEAGFQITALGFDSKVEPFAVQRVIGHDPLRQFLVEGRGGRLHAMEACWDPRKKEWFNVYGAEDRKPGEWGHWTGRGMVWNHMCASCHNTRLRKNYDRETDTYRTTMAEMTVSCESCHGPMRAHNVWQGAHTGSKERDPHAIKFTRDQAIENCTGCHARRGELTGDFVPGDSFWDHYQLTITDHTDVYHPDGQIREENYEYASFLSSRMHHAGVRCMDCHDPHSMQTILPGNQLCMRCHTQGGFPNAPVIIPEAHSFHQAASTGNQCVNCHMPQTTYMQRHPRHDHGFTIPDPLLTQEHGIPNACDKCHTDKDAAWSLAAVEKWWGPKMERKTRQRARVIAKARAGSDDARQGLLDILGSDEIPHWKASALLLLERWIHEPRVSDAVAGQAAHEHPLVRSAAARVLEGSITAGRSEHRPQIEKMLDDPARSVRTAAAWTLRDSLDESTVAGQDLLHMLRLNADQPGGQMQLGQYYFARRQMSDAIRSMETAIRWDPNSPPFHHDLAMLHSANGSTEKAIAKLRDAIRLSPRESQFHHELALALNETGDLPGAITALEEAVRLRPSFGRAWYNLGLAKSSQGKTEEALSALQRAEAAEPAEAAYPYARATILARQNRKSEAQAAAERALQINPAHPEARQLLMMLQRP